jgi:hypothetical protein
MEPETVLSTHFRPRPRLAPARKESACDRLRSRHRRSAGGYIITLHPISRTMSAWRAAQQPALFDVLCQSSASGSHCIGSRRRRPCALGDLATLKFAAVHNSQIPKAIKAIARGNERRGRFRFQHGGSGCCLAVTIVAWAGVGKSTLVNHWLRAMAAENYRSAELIFGWSFYRQGTAGQTSSADEFLDAALSWFGDPDPRLGTAWEKGERLAKLVAHRRTLLILDGLEPLQNPPRPLEGRLREPAL